MDTKTFKALVVMKLFRDQSLTIGKSNNKVTIQCDSGDDAELLFDWISSIDGKDLNNFIVETNNDKVPQDKE